MIIDVTTFAERTASMPAPALQMKEFTMIQEAVSGSVQPRQVKHRNKLFAIGGKR